MVSVTSRPISALVMDHSNVTRKEMDEGGGGGGVLNPL